MMWRSILITGATGFVGRHLTAALRQHFPEASAAFIYRGNLEFELPGWQGYSADLLDSVAVERVVAAVQPDLVVHLASISSVAAAQQGQEAARASIVEGARGLAAAVAKHAPEALVFNTSSAEVYGRAALKGPITEEVIPEPANVYGEAKLRAEQVLSDLLPTNARLINVRSFNHSGPGQTEAFVLPSWAAQVARIEAGLAPPSLLVGNVSVRRDFLHVDDVVSAYVGLLRSSERLMPRSAINVASGRAVDLSDVVDRIRRACRLPIEVVVDPKRLRLVEVPVVVGDTTQLRRLTGWAPVKSTDDLIDDLLAHWRGIFCGR